MMSPRSLPPRCTRSRLGALLLAAALGASACGGETEPTAEPPTVAPGATLQLDATVRVDAIGTYQLPQGATSLLTRCFGRVTVSYTTPGGQQRNNECQSPDGSSNQTSDVTGVPSVTFDLDPGAYGHVTVR